MPPGLLESAERLLSTSDGIFDRSGGRAFAKQITDGLLIDIQEAVSEVGDAKQPKLSGLARKRLMAWVVVDVLRSPVELCKAVADKAGGRIWLQAQRVSAALVVVAGEATSQRAAARAAAAADPNLEAGLAMEFAAIDGAELEKIAWLRDEPYIGFHELQPATVAPPLVPQIPGAATGTADQEGDEALSASNDALPVSTSPSGVRFSYLVRSPDARSGEIPAIPADLQGALGPDGVQLLFTEHSTCMEGRHPEFWWSTALPDLVEDLMRRVTRAEGIISERESEWEQAEKDLSACQYHHEELRHALELSQTRVEVLSDVLSRKNA